MKFKFLVGEPAVTAEARVVDQDVDLQIKFRDSFEEPPRSLGR